MQALDYLERVRADYLSHYRAALRKQRQTDPDCVAEMWIQPNAPPGDDRPVELICFDIFSRADGQQRAISVSTESPPEGPVLCALRVGAIEVKVHPIAWEMCTLWFAHPALDWSVVNAWRAKWLDPDRGPAPGDEDGLSGGAHYLVAEPTHEGGGYLCELDLGSAPLEALIELLQTLVEAGATEIELGCSDGSDLDAGVAAELRCKDLSPPRLTELVAQLLRQLEEIKSAEVTGPEEITVTGADGNRSPKVFTTNLYLRLQRVGIEARAKEVWSFVRGQREMMHDRGAPNLSQLRPLIKDDRFFGDIQRMSGGSMTVTARRLFADLWVCCVWDEARGMRYVTGDEPAQYGMSAEQFEARAIGNFLADARHVEVEEQGPLLVATTGDCYDASLLLDDAFWQETSRRVEGELLVCVPARDIVLITGSRTTGGIAAMRRTARQVTAGAGHLISETILVRVGDAWQRYEASGVAAAAGSRIAHKPWWKFW